MAFGLGSLAPLLGLQQGMMQGQEFNEKLRQNQILQQMRQMELQQAQQQQRAQADVFGAAKTGALNSLFQIPQMPAQQQPMAPPQQLSPTMAAGAGQPTSPLGGPDTVKGSWFGNAPGWKDPSDSGLQASGQPVSAGPGIALPSRGTLGQQFDVTAPSGQTMTLPQTDVGPAKWTGRGVDINAPAAEAMGYTPKTFPTDQNFIVKAHAVASGQLGVPGASFVQQGAPVPAVQTGAKIGAAALDDLPQGQPGSFDIKGLADAIDKVDPDAPGVVKAMALGQIIKLAAPQERMAYQMIMQQNTRQWQGELAAFRAGVTERGQDLAAQRQQVGIEAAGQRQERGIEAAGQKQERAVAAKQEAQGDSATIDAVAKGIAEYRQAPLSGWTMRSPWGQSVMAKVYADNPDYSAAQFAAGVSGARAFATGKQGDITRSMSVAIDHLAVADDLGKALQTGDVKTLNKVQNALKTEFGYEGPPDFNVAKMIVSDEVTKAVAGGNLSMAERLGLQQQLDAANSPEQLTGVSTTLKKLLGGQLRGLQRQYETLPGAGKPDFQKKISPQAREQLEGGAAKYPTATSVYDALQSGKLTKDQALGIMRDQFGIQVDQPSAGQP